MESRDEVDRLRARVAQLEDERRRAFEDAQREADALFAQYQLSQLVASGGTVAQLGAAVLLELVRLAGAAGAALFLQSVSDMGLERIGSEGLAPTVDGAPRRLGDLDAGRAWVGAIPGGRAIALSESEERRVGKECLTQCRSRWSRLDRKSTRLNSSHLTQSRMPSSA